METRFYETAADFGPVARSVYRKDPVLFTSELTALRASRRSDPQVLLAVFDDDEMGAALQMPGDALLVSGLPATMAKTAAVEVAAARHAIAGVRGTLSAATAFVTAWADVTGMRPTEEIARTLYRLDGLVPPEGMPGEARLATRDDDELLLDWLDGFFVDAHGTLPDRNSRRRVLTSIGDDGGHVVLWSADGAPVSMARVHAPAAGMCRVGPVYTPPSSRGHGFGAAVTAAAVQQAQGVGARHVVLFADVANPGANRIYRRLGFGPVTETAEYSFATA